jgi:hypothetical protein
MDTEFVGKVAELLFQTYTARENSQRAEAEK